ncbi:MAG: hypothetical protein TECD_00989 [Hyphomicrobiaceae bacterium hypho_1]
MPRVKSFIVLDYRIADIFSFSQVNHTTNSLQYVEL